MKLLDVSELIGGELIGDGSVEITGIAKIETATGSEVTFIANPIYEKHFSDTGAGAVVVSKKFNPAHYGRLDDRIVPLIKVEDPYLSFLTLLDHFSPQTELQMVGIDETAIIKDSADISSDEVRIGAHSFIGEKVKIGKRVTILPNTVILTGAEIGDDCLIYPNVTIYGGTKIGDRVIIHAGTVIGSDGFGQAKNPDGTFMKIPQKGIVVIGDDVEIGSNCSIDRATLGETIIHKGVKLDNMIQIAHNVEIGENTVIAAQTGIAGSTKIGKNCLIGGRVGITGHITICDGVTLTGATNLSKSITKPGIYSGYRSQPIRADLRQEAFIRGLSKKNKKS